MIAPDVDIADAASDDDRRWFEAHPSATERTRAYVAGELHPMQPSCPPWAARVLVLQIEPGIRVRVLLEPNV